LSKYARYLFNLQYSTGQVVTQQCPRLDSYAGEVTFMSHVTERLEHENAILHRGTHESTEKDLEMQTAYHHLSEAEHGWHFTHQQLDLAHEEVDTRTHAIVHLENAIETQDTELEERAEIIADLEQQLLELQEEAPPTPKDPEEIDAMSGIDEE
jgi:chromosome segregation ATPase